MSQSQSQFPTDMTDYVLVMHDIPKTNWDAALTLGTCVLVAGAVISPLISRLYKRYREDDRRLWNIMLGIILIVVFYLGTITAVLLLGYWTAYILDALGIEQGVHRPWTPGGLIPFD